MRRGKQLDSQPSSLQGSLPPLLSWQRPAPCFPVPGPQFSALSFLALLGGGRADLFPLAPGCRILSRAVPLLAHPHLVIFLSPDPTSFPFLHSSTRQRARCQEHSPGLCLPWPSLPLLPAEPSCLRVYPLAGDTKGSLAALRGPCRCLAVSAERPAQPLPPARAGGAWQRAPCQPQRPLHPWGKAAKPRDSLWPRLGVVTAIS